MQEVQTFSLFPLLIVAHWRFGYLLVFFVGLYLPRNKFLLRAIIVPFLHIKHSFAIEFMLYYIEDLCKK